MATGVGDVELPAFTLDAESLHAAVYDGDVTLAAITLSGSLQGPSELPAFTLSGTAVAGVAAVGDPFLPAVTVAGTALLGRTGVGAALLPGVTLAASTGTRGSAVLPRLTVFATGLTGNTSKGRNRVIAGVTVYETQPTLPGFTLEATLLSQVVATGEPTLSGATLSATGIGGGMGTGDLNARPHTLAATGLTGGAPSGSDASAGLTLPAFTLVGTIAYGSAATGSITLPGFELASTQQPEQPQPRTGAGDATLRAATLAGTMLPGSLATGSPVLRELTLSAFLGNSPPMTGDLTLAEFTLSGVSTGTNVADAAIRIEEHSLSATGLTGTASTASLELPLVQLSAQDGVLDVVGTAIITLPLFNIGGSSSGIGGVGGTLIQILASPEFVGIALNTRTRAVSNYSALAPTSAASFGGVTLMTTADGIVALLGDDDEGEPIEAYLTSGKTDFDVGAMQRVLCAYVGYRASGDMELTMIADDHHENVYTLAPRRVEDQQHASRVKFGRGCAGVYWQFKAANVDGADFALDRIELLTARTGAKV